MLVENWLEWEKSLVDAAQAAEPSKPADQSHLDHVEKLLPKRIKRKRTVKAEDGTDAGWEEYYDYTFPDEQAAQPQLAILQFAHMWKKQKMLTEESAKEKEAEEEKSDDEEDPQALFERAEAEAEQEKKKQKKNLANPDSDDSD
jgi:crooked neck